MTTLTQNLRKAAILIRSVDADTAATLLAQLTPAEAKAVRAAIHSLGEFDVDERDDVAAEFRRIGATENSASSGGVELAFSSGATEQADASKSQPKPGRPFEFLEHARVESLVPYLAREHGQTIAIVLSYLAPDRAAAVLGALPPRLQVEALERLSVLGETDPTSVEVVERELADWVRRQRASRSRDVCRIDAVEAILTAANRPTRDRILSNVAQHNQPLADRITLPAPVGLSEEPAKPPVQQVPVEAPKPVVLPPRTRPTMPFESLVHVDKSILGKVLGLVDAEVLALALSGASDALVNRVAERMPRATAKVFRRRLRQLGPTRLSDVDSAQREVASLAAELIQSRRTGAGMNSK